MNKITQQTLERFVKAVVSWNKEVEFDEKYLELQDYFELIVEKKGEVLIFKTILKKD